MKTATGATTLYLDEGTLRYAITHHNIEWKQAESYAPYFDTKNGQVAFKSAGKVWHRQMDTGIGTGILSHYEAFPGMEGEEDFSFETYVWIEYATEDVHFEWIPRKEPEGLVQSVSWPGPMDFCGGGGDLSWYTLLNIQQGLLIPNGWERELSDIPFQGRLCTAGSYMPWFGQVKEGAGYLAICEQPQDAGYKALHPAKAAYTLAGWVLYPSLGRLSYRRTFVYHMEEDCDYNTLCKYYRQYVIEKGTFRTLKEKAERADVDKLVGSVFVHTGIKTQVQPNSRFFDPENPEKNNHLTPFSEREKEVKHWKKLGIKKLYLHLDGWGEPGYDNQHPDYLPACEEAGGFPGMKALADTLQECGYSFGVHDQYRDYYFAAKTFDENSAVHLADGTLPQHANWAGGPQTYLCASLAPFYVKRNFAELEKQKIHLDCAYLDVFTCNEPDECSHPWHHMTRKECLEYRNQCFSYLLSKNILPSSEEVTDWSVPNLVFCHYAPYDFMMRKPNAPKQGIPVPLFNLVYHDCILIPWMMEKHGSEDYMLYALLNGGAPYFVRRGAYEGTDGSFLGGESFSEEEMLARCETVAALHEKVAYREMLSHEFVENDPWRQRTTFADGTAVEVNLTEGTFQIC